jgi:hypothetical protein
LIASDVLPGPGTPINPFDTHEFTATELTGLVRATGFRVERLLGPHAGRRLRALDRTWDGSFVDAQLAAPPEDWPEGLLADVAGISAGDFPVTDADPDSSLDLLVLAAPAG